VITQSGAFAPAECRHGVAAGPGAFAPTSPLALRSLRSQTALADGSACGARTLSGAASRADVVAFCLDSEEN